MEIEAIKKTLRTLQDVAFEAGEILLHYQRKRHNLTILDKGSEGIASTADVESEKFILATLKKEFPGHNFLSEEDQNQDARPTESPKEKGEASYCWVIDPLDGTNNFVNGIPIYAVSIGLLKNGSPLLGVVYNPTSGEYFYAGEGVGSFFIDFRINPFKKYKLEVLENHKKMRECIFSPSPVYDIESRFERQLSAFKKNIVGARAVRRLGSAALELCYVGCGNFDGYWEAGLKAWDVCAAGIICQEAGVILSDFEGLDFNVFNESILAAANPLHTKILGKLKKS